MVNKNVLAARLDRLREYLDMLKAIQVYPLTDFIKDPFVYGAAERYLHLAIECLLDIGNHVISDRGYIKPDSYADVFRILGDNEVIPAPLCRELEGMASFRNLLVHDYLRLDRQKVYQIIQGKVKSLEQLAAVFADLL